jgi:hypothetical protein
MPDNPPSTERKALPEVTGDRADAGRRRVPWAWRAISVRLRFVAVFAIASLVVAGWDVIVNAWDKLTRGAIAPDPGAQVVSGDTEYFCPMDPGVVGDWPSKCPICNMALVRRVRGDAAPLPDGVIARMQLSPYRLQLAGIRSAAVDYQPLALVVEGPARVLESVPEPDSTAEVEVEVFEADLSRLAEGVRAEVLGPWPDPLRGTVRSLPSGPVAGGASVLLAVEDPDGRLRPGMSLRARLLVPMASLEPFRSLQVEPPPLRKGERRRVYACDEHAEVVEERPGRCPTDGRELARRDLSESQRLRWWCPMHPEVTADVPGRRCEACGGMSLRPRVVSYAPAGRVLAVPESAVVDTGTRRVVYVERMPGMFDGVEVVLGPRCGDAFPVVRGLEPGQRVVASGTFLVDAETHLNPSLAASYFGASGREASSTPPPGKASALDGLDPADRALAERQVACPVTGKPLGSMGTPIRLDMDGRVVFLCCEGCEPAIRKAPDRYLGKLPPEPKQAP